MYADGEGLFNGDYTELAASTSIMGVDLSAGYFTEVEALYVELGFSTGAVDIAFGYGDDQADGFYAGGGSGLVNMSFSGSKDIQISDGQITSLSVLLRFPTASPCTVRESESGPPTARKHASEPQIRWPAPGPPLPTEVEERRVQ